jgi:hypothetical protein
VLQLAAPQARFRKADGEEFLRLKFAPWPLLEVMTPWRPAPEKPLAEALMHHVSYTKAAMKAHAFRAVLTGQPLEELKNYISYGEKIILEHFRLAGLTCHFDTLGTESLVPFTNMAAATIPYLRQEDCQKLWITPVWLKCPPKNPLLRDYLHFLSSVAARDHGHTFRRGEMILTEYEEILFTKEMKTIAVYVVGAMQVAAYALGEYEEVLALDGKFKKEQNPDFVRTFLVQAAKGENKRE